MIKDHVLNKHNMNIDDKVERNHPIGYYDINLGGLRHFYTKEIFFNTTTNIFGIADNYYHENCAADIVFDKITTKRSFKMIKSHKYNYQKSKSITSRLCLNKMKNV